MSSCERCWRDPQRDPSCVDSVEEYHRLIAERVGDKACTPEQQAGPDAGECPMCHRRTLHQYTDEPMCGCINRHHAEVIKSWQKEAERVRSELSRLTAALEERTRERDEANAHNGKLQLESAEAWGKYRALKAEMRDLRGYVSRRAVNGLVPQECDAVLAHIDAAVERKALEGGK